MSKLNQLLNNIEPGAMFYVGTDNDAVLVAFAGGNGMPYISAWDKTGYREYTAFDFDEFEPISREQFIQLVKSREPL